MALRKGSKPFLVGFPPGLKERAADAARRDGRSLSNWIIRLIEREVSSMTTLTWTHENHPDWDSTGTVAESWYATWYATAGKYACRIDRFTDDQGFAYTIEYDGNPVRHGENEPADSFDAAESAILRLLAR